MADLITGLRHMGLSMCDQAADEIERLGAQLKHQYELNDAAAEDADALRIELAKAREILEDVRRDMRVWVINGKVLKRIDAWLKRRETE